MWGGARKWALVLASGVKELKGASLQISMNISLCVNWELGQSESTTPGHLSFVLIGHGFDNLKMSATSCKS